MDNPVRAEDFDWNRLYHGTTADYEPPNQRILDAIDALPPGRALDVGCGAGGLVAALAERGWSVTGVDIAETGIAAARAVLAERGLDAELRVADARVWKPGASFDLITNSFATPVHRRDRVPVWAMMRDALAPGGHVVIESFDPGMNRFRFFEDIEMLSEEEMREAFVGFEIVRAQVGPTPAHHHAHEHDQHECAHGHHHDVPAHSMPGEDEWTSLVFVARRA